MQARLLGMPLLVVNLGAEMVYILEQRLRAQKIAKDKSSKGEIITHSSSKIQYRGRAD